MNVILIGYRASGKTSVGKKVSELQGVPFWDTDELVQRRAGKNIRQIVQDGGWPEFRRAERDAVAEVVRQDGAVIALGGGAVMDPGNVVLLKRRGWFVWLQADEDTLRKRLEADGSTPDQRPSLAAQGERDAKELPALRTPVYRELADLTLDTTGMSVEQAAEKVLAAFRREP